MASKTVDQREDLDQLIDEVNAEIATLEERLQQASKQIAQADKHLAELGAQREALAVGAFTGDEEATESSRPWRIATTK